MGIKISLLEHLTEVSTLVTEPLRLNNPHTFDVLLNEIHVPDYINNEMFGKVSHFSLRIQDNSRKTSTFAR